jgi:hypothetical protein
MGGKSALLFIVPQGYATRRWSARCRAVEDAGSTGFDESIMGSNLHGDAEMITYINAGYLTIQVPSDRLDKHDKLGSVRHCG